LAILEGQILDPAARQLVPNEVKSQAVFPNGHCLTCLHEEERRFPGVLGTPGLLSEAVDYQACRKYNATGVALDPGDLETLQQTIDSWNAAIKSSTEKAISEFHDYVEIKLEAGEFEEIPAGQGVRAPTDDEQASVAAVPQPNGTTRIVEVFPGEWSPVDVAFQDAWDAMYEARHIVMEFFHP